MTNHSIRNICALVAVVVLIGCQKETSSVSSSDDSSSKITKAGQKTNSFRYLALGDSYTIGESVAEADRWPIQLADKLNDAGVSVDKPQIIAVTGWTTDELMNGITEADPQGPFDLVTLLIGVNNQYRGRSVEDFRTELQTLLATSTKLAGGDPQKVLLLSIPDWGVTPFAKKQGKDSDKVAREIDQYNAVKKEEAEKLGMLFVDITPGSRKAKNDSTLLASDGLHPSGKMYEQWADAAINGALEILGEEPLDPKK